MCNPENSRPFVVQVKFKFNSGLETKLMPLMEELHALTEKYDVDNGSRLGWFPTD